MEAEQAFSINQLDENRASHGSASAMAGR